MFVQSELTEREEPPPLLSRQPARNSNLRLRMWRASIRQYPTGVMA